MLIVPWHSVAENMQTPLPNMPDQPDFSMPITVSIIVLKNRFDSGNFYFAYFLPLLATVIFYLLFTYMSIRHLWVFNYFMFIVFMYLNEGVLESALRLKGKTSIAFMNFFDDYNLPKLQQSCGVPLSYH